jgi:hypothetical protein
MPIRRLCPTHVYVAIGSTQDVALTQSHDNATLAEISGFQVWVRGRTETAAAPGEPPQVRFDLAPLTASRLD